MDLFKHLAEYSPYWSPIIFFLVGITGSFHCLGMCGGLISVCGIQPKSLLTYQLGRLISYLLVTTGFYFLGKEVLLGFIERYNLVFEISFGVFILLFVLGFLLKNRPIVYSSAKLQKVFNSVLKIKNFKIRAGALGLGTALLPCGYLYLVIGASLILPTLAYSCLAVLGFWFGTLPALQGGISFIGFILKKLKVNPVWLCIFILFFAFSSLGYRSYANSINKEESSGVQSTKCH